MGKKCCVVNGGRKNVGITGGGLRQLAGCNANLRAAWPQADNLNF